MATSTDLLVLGIDAASPELIRRWAADGELPVLRDLLDRGLSGPVEGVRGFFIGSTWPSFYTGLGPAGHGFHRIRQLKPGTYRFFRPLASPAGLGGTPFWRLASDAGRRVAVLDVPLSRIEPELNGIQVVEWGGHDAVFGFRTSPPELAGEIRSGVGPYPLPSTCDRRRRGADEFEAYVRGLEEAVARKKELTLDLLGRGPWDLFLQVFTEAHCVGHQAWHIHDPAHPAHDPELLSAVGDPLLRVYRAVDRALGEILERAEADRVLLFSAHGMSFYRGAPFLLPEILFRLGVATRPPEPSPGEEGPDGERGGPSPDGRGLMRGAKRVARAAWHGLPGAARDVFRPLRDAFGPARVDAGASSRVGVDVSRSRCFPVQNGSPVGGVRLNLAGREPRGVLRPGPEADAFCEELARELRAIVDRRTGAPLISDVHRTRDLHAGPRLDFLPDLLVEWTREVPTGSLCHGGGRGATIRASSPRIGTVEGANAYVRTGDHVPTGLFAFVGPGIPAGRRDDPVPLTAFHPTLCRLLGLPDPGVDGDVVPELVAAGAGGGPDP